MSELEQATLTLLLLNNAISEKQSDLLREIALVVRGAGSTSLVINREHELGELERGRSKATAAVLVAAGRLGYTGPGG